MHAKDSNPLHLDEDGFSSQVERNTHGCDSWSDAVGLHYTRIHTASTLDAEHSNA